MIAAFARRYGASPAHLAGHLALGVVAVIAISGILDAGAPINAVAWLLAAVMLHDLVFLPAYSALDRLAQRVPAPVPLVNHLRVPAVLSGTLLLVFFPGVLAVNDGTLVRASGHGPGGVARNWALITAAAFLGSALAYGVRVFRARR